MSQKLAYVTGGMGGIGTAICRKFHDMGYTVVAGCGPTRDFAKWLAEQKADGYTFHASVGNVADWESTRAAFEKVRAELGAPDILVNNAGINRLGPFEAIDDATFLALQRINLVAPSSVRRTSWSTTPASPATACSARCRSMTGTRSSAPT
jgi:acetoacetyl-CoA reductase